ncbi:MAG: ATP-grasp domain-containing protein [Thermotogae bacterium]|nr:ATP-grasp domain-containing protein [Thermotogota bacterium]
MKVLIANRGEVALRLHRTLSELGFKTVGIFTKEDENWPFTYELDEVYPVNSYLNIKQILEVAQKSRANVIHPGYGFLSENPNFARAVREAGLIFVGPTAEAMEMVGDKARAKEVAQKVGVPTVPGSPPSDDPHFLAKEIERIGLPVLLKAVAGGGGKGMRVLRRKETLLEDILSAQREALGAFGDGRLMAERYVFPARHVEVQVIGWKGNVLILGERECSLQRRHQKILEETPSPALNDSLREKLYDYARRVALAVGYTNAGTVEFLYDEGRKEFYFLEVNARLQVEHPVTEMVSGLDLVRLQMEVALEGKPSISQRDVILRGHSIEVRLYAEDPDRDFLPSVGKLEALEFPVMPGVRIDSGVMEGTEISHLYDPMIAKVIVHAPDREQARRRLISALKGILLFGPKTNLHFLIYVLESQEYVSGNTYTHTVRDLLKLYHEETFELPSDVEEFVRSWKYISKGDQRGEALNDPILNVKPILYP